jgi:hypothetical protein
MKHAIVFGRFNPPTIGHGVLFEALNSFSRKGISATLYTSHSHILPVNYRRAQKLLQDNQDLEKTALILAKDAFRNPLAWEQKIEFLTRLRDAENLQFDICNDPEIKTTDDMFLSLAEQGKKDLILIAGSDRISGFQEVVERYNNSHAIGIQVNVKFHSAGERDPDADDVTGMSATKLRFYAILDDFQSFAQGIGGDKDLAWDIFQAVRNAMDIPESLGAKKESAPKNALSSYLDEYIFTSV